MKFGVLLLGVLNSALIVASLSCQGADWFAGIKAPDGYNYYSYGQGTFTATDAMDSGNDPVGQTLQQIYGCSGCGYLLYNDNPPNHDEDLDKAHAKGVIGFDEDGGFWLVHSVPRFPYDPSAQSYQYPSDETTYGQSFLCLSLGLDALNDAAAMLLIDYPFTYASNLPSSLSDQLPNINSLIQGQASTGQTNHTFLFTTGGANFTAFGKSASSGIDLYEDLVEPFFNQDMEWETWADQAGKLPSYCKPQYNYDSLNILSVKLPDGTAWKTTKDHCKWGISLTGNTVCIGDINRVDVQRKRGGGTVCAHDSDYWTAFNSIVDTVDSC